MTDQPADPQTWARIGRLAEAGVLTSSLLHELRQPLFAIKSLVELEVVAARDAASGEAGRERRLRTVLGQIEHLEALVSHYGGMGRDDDDPVRVDGREPARAAVDMLAHRARQIGAELVWSGGDAPVWITARPSAVRQIVLNLVQNALDAVEGGMERRVMVVIHAGAGLCLDVQDTGGGIGDDVRDTLFDPFITTKPMPRGTGLGLYITRLLARELGGDVTIGATSPSGTTMRVVLPPPPSPAGQA